VGDRRYRTAQPPVYLSGETTSRCKLKQPTPIAQGLIPTFRPLKSQRCTNVAIGQQANCAGCFHEAFNSRSGSVAHINFEIQTLVSWDTLAVEPTLGLSAKP